MSMRDEIPPQLDELSLLHVYLLAWCRLGYYCFISGFYASFVLAFMSCLFGAFSSISHAFIGLPMLCSASLSSRVRLDAFLDPWCLGPTILHALIHEDALGYFERVLGFEEPYLVEKGARLQWWFWALMQTYSVKYMFYSTEYILTQLSDIFTRPSTLLLLIYFLTNIKVPNLNS